MTRVLAELAEYFPPGLSARQGVVFSARYQSLFGKKRDYIGRVISVGKFSFLAQVLTESPPTKNFNAGNFVKRFWFGRLLMYREYRGEDAAKAAGFAYLFYYFLTST
ncbi:MAG: hypothetical protein AABX07_00590 [Nanoarchaeota archaeon]